LEWRKKYPFKSLQAFFLIPESRGGDIRKKKYQEMTK